MSIDIKQQDEFVKNGFLILRNSIPLELLQEARTVMRMSLCRLLLKDISLEEGIKEACEIYQQIDVQDYLNNQIQAQKIERKILLLPSIMNFSLTCIGGDLAYNPDRAIAINIAKTSDNLYMKALHQEIWSGAGVMEIRIWLPVLMQGSTGGINVIPESHSWGLIPNRKRAPFDVPEDVDMRSVVPEVTEGDAILFHSMTLHATEANLSHCPRVAITLSIRNIYYEHTGYEHIRSWQPYHFSPMGRIQKILGNPWLSPYRTVGTPNSHRIETTEKKVMPNIFD